MIVSMTTKIARGGAKRAEYFTFQLTISCPCPEPLLVSLLSTCFNLKKLVVGMIMMEMTMVKLTAYTQNTYGTNTYRYSFRR